MCHSSQSVDHHPLEMTAGGVPEHTPASQGYIEAGGGGVGGGGRGGEQEEEEQEE